MMSQFPPTWQRFFAQPAAAALASTPPLVPSLLAAPPSPAAGLPGEKRPYEGRAGTEAGGTSGSTALPPTPPKPPVDQRPIPPEPPRRPLEFAWLTWQMPAHIQEQAKEALRLTLNWRARYCKPLDAPKAPHDYTRFGLVGEQLVPKGAITVRKSLRAELREMVRALEGAQSRTERNYLLAMHSVRLGQLCAELGQRGLDVLEEVRNGLAMLWA